MTTRPARVASGLLALAAIACVGVAGYLYYPAATFGPAWQKAEAVVMSTTLEKTHDSLGRLLFQLRAVMRFDAQGTQQIGNAVSPFPTHDLARIARKLAEFRPKSMHTIYYRRDRPEEIRFGSELLWLNARKPLMALGAGALFAVTAVVLLFKRAPRECSECGERRKSYYKFCPRCGTPVAQSETVPAHSEPLEEPGEGAAESAP